MIPLVYAFTTKMLNVSKPAHVAIDHHAIVHLLHHFFTHVAEHTHSIFALDLRTWVHQTIREFAIRGKQQKPTGVNIQTSNRNPAPVFNRRKAVEDSRPSLGIFASTNLILGLIIKNHTTLMIRFQLGCDLFPVDDNFIVFVYAVSDLGSNSVDLNPPFFDPRLGLAPRGKSCARHDFL